MSCAGQQRGSLATIVLDFESTYGVDPTPAAIQVPFISESIKGDREQNVSEVINGTRNPSRPFQGNLDVGGDISVPVDKRYFGYWLKALMGAPTTTGVGPYTHTYKVNDTNCQPSMVIEKFMSDIPRYFKFNGMKVASMSLNVGGSGELTANFSLLGSTVADSATVYDASPTTHSYAQFKNLDCVLNEGGSLSGEFTTLGMEIGCNLDGDVFTIGGGGNRTSLPEGKYSIGGSGEALFDNMTLYNKGLNSTESSIEIVATSGTESLTIDFNEVEYGQATPQVAGNEGVLLNLNFQAYDDDDAANSAVVFTLVNDIATY